MLSQAVVMLHDNALQHTATATQDLIATLGWEQFDHPLYSPDLVPSDFHVFLHPKTFVGGRWFKDDEVKEVVCIAGGIILRCRDTKTGAPL
jgi:histone-lysine N-methyltransferase SETMAR